MTILVFLLLTVTVCLACDVNLWQMVKWWKTAYKEKLPSTSVGKGISKLEDKRNHLLKQCQMSTTAYYCTTAMGAMAGFVVGKLVFAGYFFACFMAVMGACLPLLYLYIQNTKYRAITMDQLRESMTTLSVSYLVTEDFIQSVEDNVAHLPYPKPFADFFLYVTQLGGNGKVGLRRMADQVDNPYFRQWVDVLILAQDDRRLKYVTLSVIESMNDVAQAQLEVDTAMYTVWQEYFTVLVLIFSAPLIFKILLAPAYTILVSTIGGQILLTLLLSSIVYSVVRVVELNKPLLI